MTAKPPPKKRSPAHTQGYRHGMRTAIAWLHAEAARMNDPHARNILNSAAFSLGSIYLRKSSDMPPDDGGEA